MYRIVDNKKNEIVRTFGDYQSCFEYWRMLVIGHRYDTNRYTIESYRLFSNKWIDIDKLNRKDN